MSDLRECFTCLSKDDSPWDLEFDFDGFGQAPLTVFCRKVFSILGFPVLDFLVKISWVNILYLCENISEGKLFFDYEKEILEMGENNFMSDETFCAIQGVFQNLGYNELFSIMNDLKRLYDEFSVGADVDVAAVLLSHVNMVFQYSGWPIFSISYRKWLSEKLFECDGFANFFINKDKESSIAIDELLRGYRALMLK